MLGWGNAVFSLRLAMPTSRVPAIMRLSIALNRDVSCLPDVASVFVAVFPKTATSGPSTVEVSPPRIRVEESAVSTLVT
jgi:hypothetical protein